MLSVRSPTIEIAATAVHSSTNGQTSTLKTKFAASQATRAAASTPPTTPSQVFLGETRGASGTRPNHRPAKNAPVSAAQTSASVNSTQYVLRVVNVTYTSASQHGTSASRPASPADNGLTRVGAKHTHRKATIHHAMATAM